MKKSPHIRRKSPTGKLSHGQPAARKPAPEYGAEPTFPMRINKYLAWKKHSTRRGADELIEKKQVFINGRAAVLGDKVNAADQIEVRFRGAVKPYIYIAYN